MLSEKKYIILLELQALHDITTPIEVYFYGKKNCTQEKIPCGETSCEPDCKTKSSES